MKEEKKYLLPHPTCLFNPPKNNLPLPIKPKNLHPSSPYELEPQKESSTDQLTHVPIFPSLASPLSARFVGEPLALEFGV